MVAPLACNGGLAVDQRETRFIFNMEWAEAALVALPGSFLPRVGQDLVPSWVVDRWGSDWPSTVVPIGEFIRVIRLWVRSIRITLNLYSEGISYDELEGPQKR